MAENNTSTTNPQKAPNKVQRRNSGTRTQLSDFTDIVQIGRGAFGKVFKAKFIKLGRDFALKRISKKEIQNQYMISQLGNQIKISQSLKHQNIIRLFDTFEENQYFYLVLQLAQKGQLYSLLKKKGSFSQQETKSYIRDVVSAVKYLHSQNPPVIHRDIKPENILLMQNGRVKLADFGWSNFSNKPRKTYCGTIHYLAPEMIDKSGHNQKLDIWCIGVLVYQFLTGKTPFIPRGEVNNQSAFKKQIEENILNLRIEFPQDFPTQAKSFVLGMIKRNPKERMTLEEIQNHPWLAQKQPAKQIMSNPSINPIGTSNSISNQQSTVIETLKAKIRQLQEQIKDLKMNASNPTTDVTAQNSQQKTAIMKELRQLKVTMEMNQRYKEENDKLYCDLSSKQKHILQLKNNMNKLQQKIDDYQRLQDQKRALQEKLQNCKKQLEGSKQNQKRLKQQLGDLNSTIPNKVKNGQKLTLKDMNTNEFVFYLQEQLQIISEQFQTNKKILDKAIEKERITEQKQNQLIQLRVEQKSIKQQIKAELKQQYEAQKDQIILCLRNQMTEQRDKWLRDYEEVKNLYSDNQGIGHQNSNNNSERQNDLMFEIKNLKQVNLGYEKMIKDQENRIKDLEEQLKRNK